MLKLEREWNIPAKKRQAGFTLLETLVSLVILLAVSGIVMTGMMQLMQTQGTIANRTEMHTSVRSATELLQQEIGQAGMVSLPINPATGLTIPLYMVTPVVPPVPDVPWTQAVILSSIAGIFNGEQLVVDTGLNQETVTVTCGNPCTNPISATFNYNHAGGVPGTPVTAQGAFATGIVPPTIAGGSTGTVLKLYGDINGDGNMLYVEYTCDWANANGFGPVLFRNEMPYDTPLKAAFPLNAGKILLSNLDPLGNPNDQNGNPVPCFTYQTQTVLTNTGPDTFVTDVAVTLTEQTQNLDPQTHQFQKETKALLNVSPRNVFNAWELASAELTDRVQPMPPSVTGLIGQ
ncbi:MAG TPA: type II secretion system protein [Terriglobales bacterium]|nr:type II secretion system protein [Terriglobales bacterium]